MTMFPGQLPGRITFKSNSGLTPCQMHIHLPLFLHIPMLRALFPILRRSTLHQPKLVRPPPRKLSILLLCLLSDYNYIQLNCGLAHLPSPWQAENQSGFLHSVIRWGRVSGLSSSQKASLLISSLSWILRLLSVLLVLQISCVDYFHSCLHYQHYHHHFSIQEKISAAPNSRAILFPSNVPTLIRPTNHPSWARSVIRPSSTSWFVCCLAIMNDYGVVASVKYSPNACSKFN